MASKGKTFVIIGLIMVLVFSVAVCAGCFARDSGDPEYEARTITIEGLNPGSDTEAYLTEISVGELRNLSQHKLAASYKRTTGLTEEFKMAGPYLQEVIEHLGGDLEKYAGMGVVGRDGYYCLLSKAVLQDTPELMLAVNIDGEAKLDADNYPARLAVPGQFGPYWVRQVDKIILYTRIPEKEITTVWIFDQLAQGIEPYSYEYYGSKDNAIDLEQVFSRLDYVDNKAFFTMKSADGFKKNEVINMVKSRYYIKVEGADAPTNVSPYIKLGMNVQKIAWVSTNADAAIFPKKMMEYMEPVELEGQTGLPLQEVLYETEVKAVKSETFDLLGTEGEKIRAAGQDMSRGILVVRDDGTVGVVWDKNTDYEDIPNLLCIRQVKNPSADVAGGQENTKSASGDAMAAGSALRDAPAADTILTVSGDGVSHPVYLSLQDLKNMKKGYVEQCFSTVNNYPTRKFMAVKGVDLIRVLEQAGMKPEAATFVVQAADGYQATLTREQLMEKRYCFLNLLSGSSANAVEVKPVLAWAEGTGQDFSKAQEQGGLRLMIGQKGLQDVNTGVAVQQVTKISVSTGEPGKWEEPRAELAGGQITLQHDFMDQIKIYYTLDGSEPNENSWLYNPSTSYFQPHLIQPILVQGSGTLKAKVTGYGKKDSEVLSYVF